METVAETRGNLHYSGYKQAIPGILCVLLLVILPGIISLVTAVFGTTENNIFSLGIAELGSIVLLLSLLGGAMGGILAALLGITLGWALQGSRMKYFWLCLLCFPAVMGDVAASAVFQSGPAWLFPEMLTRILYILWRLVGPTALFASLIYEIPAGRLLPERISFKSWMHAGWRRWREFVGIIIFAGILFSLAGAGHINPVFPDSASTLTGPADFVWMDVTNNASVAWAVITWPLYLVTAAGVMVFVRRLNGRLHGSSEQLAED